MTVLKSIGVIGIILLFCVVIFNSNRYVSLLKSADKVESFDLANLTEFANYQNSTLSPAEILNEMEAKGWLKKNYSERFVSLEGQPNGLGTIDSPIDLVTALTGGKGKSTIKAGDIVWLRGGRYVGSFTVKIAGKPDAPIHFRQYPGERAVLDKSEAIRETATLNVRSPYVWFWDFEITNTFSNRQRLDNTGKLNPWRGSGINVWAANTKYINLIIHDNGHGFGLWNEEGGTEIYGCLIFNNGNNKKEHGIYAHNKIGTQTIANNLIFNNAGYGLHVYANSTKSSTNGFDIENNAVFNNGSLMLEDQVADQILVGSVEGVPSERILIRGNAVYNFPDAPTSKNRGVRLGYRDKENKDVKIQNNLIVSKVPLKILWWQLVETTGNTIVTSGKSVEIETPTGIDFSNYKFASNNYLTRDSKKTVFVLNNTKTDLNEWQSKLKYDAIENFDKNELNSKLSFQIFLNANKYDNSLANLVIYNAEKTSDVSVELKSFFKDGESFEIRDAQNYFDKPVLSGVYNGKPIQLKMNADKITLPIGKTEQIPMHTGSDFAVFVIRKISSRSNRQK
jgi:hypothetical protein